MYFSIINWLKQHELPCLFKQAFHVDCPGCGLQRSCIALLKGNLLESIRFYPAILPVLLLFIYLTINRFAKYRFPVKVAQWGIVFVFFVILASYLIKLTTTF